MRCSRLAALAVVVLLLNACQAGSPAALVRTPVNARAMADADLYPLANGRTWTYALDQQQGDGPVQHNAMTIVTSAVTEVSPGVTQAVLDRHYGSFTPPSTRVRKSADAVTLSRLSDPVGGPSITILHFPLTVGTSWPGRDFGGGNTETIWPQGPENVTVPAGTYVAQRVDHHIHYAQGSEDVLSYWYAPGVGVVKMIERLTVWQGTQAVHLVSTGSLTMLSGSAAESSSKGLAPWGFLAAPGVFPPGSAL